MCGISGIFSRDKSDRLEIRTVTASIKHRGPDAEGFFEDDYIALGHRRLSIIDLDARSNQPFTTNDGRYVIVYNGEIYNYKSITKELRDCGVTLRTTSDTEVLVEAFVLWGPGFVHKLNGMFAFVIYDSITHQLFLCRDRDGKKPLYYFLSDKLFVFGSELKAVTSHSFVRKQLKVNKSTLSVFLQLGYIPKPNTFYENISKFPDGHYGIVSPQFKLSILPYWNIAHSIKYHRDITEQNAFNQLKRLFYNSVNLRLIADVPVGIFLSGGIDSSLVTAVAAQTTKLKTFSIGFKESKFDESFYARKVAAHLKTEHYEFVLREKDAVELVDIYLDHFDEPFADTSSIPTMLISKLARKEVKVALTGDGGDELFLGYGSHTWAKRLDNYVVKALRPVLHSVLNHLPSPRAKRVSHLFEKLRPGKQRRHIFSQEQYLFSEHEVLSDLLTDKNYYADWVYDDLRYLRTLTEPERQALFDLQFYLRDDLLAKVDRASMYYGLECRCPMMDHEFVQFVVNLPENLKKRGNVSKYLLKQILFELVPEKYFDRPKWGFSIPLAQWLKNDLQYLFEYLNEENLNKTNVFNIGYVNSLKDKFQSGQTYLYNRLWALIIAQKFLLKYGA
jgi:asparagine synthase (glutamine-hydrolysing)